MPGCCSTHIALGSFWQRRVRAQEPGMKGSSNRQRDVTGMFEKVAVAISCHACFIACFLFFFSRQNAGTLAGLFVCLPGCLLAGLFVCLFLCLRVCLLALVFVLFYWATSSQHREECALSPKQAPRNGPEAVFCPTRQAISGEATNAHKKHTNKHINKHTHNKKTPNNQNTNTHKKNSTNKQTN